MGRALDAGGRLTETQKLDWLRLIRYENVGPRTCRSLLNHYGGARAALAALPDLARRGGAPCGPRICALDDAEREMATAQELGITLIGWDEPDYPARLREIDDAPPLLAVGRHPAPPGGPRLAVVGSPHPAAGGTRSGPRPAPPPGGA